MSAPLRFPAPATPLGQDDRNLSPQQRFVSEAFAIFDDCSAERPAPSLLCRWRRRHFDGDSAAMLFALNLMGDKGQLSRPVEYIGTVLANGAASGALRATAAAPERRLEVGQRSLDGSMQFDGKEWWPVTPQQPKGREEN